MNVVDVTVTPADWRVVHWGSVVREALGIRSLVSFRLAFAVVLLPSVMLAAYGVWSQRPALLIWVLLALWGVWTSSTRPTGIGILANLVVAIASGIVAGFQQDWLFILLGLLPGCSWFASCAILGTTAQYLLEALRSSPELAHSLTGRGVLIPVNATKGGEDSL